MAEMPDWMRKIYNFLRLNDGSKCMAFKFGEVFRDDRTKYHFALSDSWSLMDPEFYSAEHIGDVYSNGNDEDGDEDLADRVQAKPELTGEDARRDFIDKMENCECYKVTDASGAVVFSGEAPHSV